MSISRAQAHTQEQRALKLAVAVYAFIFAIKLVVYFMTGVMAVLAEALHTLADIFVSGFLLLAVIFSRRPADRTHMFGYGRAQNVAALVAATLFISFTSLKLYEEAIPRLFNPAEAEHRNLGWALAVLLVSMLVAAAPLIRLLRQRERGAAVRAQIMELINDQLGLGAALIGTLLVMAGFPLADPIAALVVATIIAINAVGLFWENLCLLIGRSPGPEFIASVGLAAQSVEGVLGVHGLRAETIGPDEVHVDLHLEVAPRTPIEEADRIAEQVRDRLDAIGSSYAAIHVESVGASRQTEVDW